MKEEFETWFVIFSSHILEIKRKNWPNQYQSMKKLTFCVQQFILTQQISNQLFLHLVLKCKARPSANEGRGLCVRAECKWRILWGPCERPCPERGNVGSVVACTIISEICHCLGIVSLWPQHTLSSKMLLFVRMTGKHPLKFFYQRSHKSFTKPCWENLVWQARPRKQMTKLGWNQYIEQTIIARVGAYGWDGNHQRSPAPVQSWKAASATWLSDWQSSWGNYGQTSLWDFGSQVNSSPIVNWSFVGFYISVLMWL